MKYTFGMGSNAIVYIPRFIKTSLGMQKLLRGRYTETNREKAGLMIPTLFFQNRESGLNMSFILDLFSITFLRPFLRSTFCATAGLYEFA
jgi:hypothetical protein